MEDFDRISAAILQTLEQRGRISNQELAERVGLSASACLRRVQDLERRGIITGYRAVTDRTKLGVGLTAYMTIGLTDQSKASQVAFEKAMVAAPEVRECHNITGSWEYLLRVEATDLAAYKHFHSDVLGALPNVRAITTYVVMESPKDMRA